MSFFPSSQNPQFYNCKFYDYNHSSSALQILLSATAPGAAYDSEERQPPPRCLPRTRVKILQKIQDWEDGGLSRILWVHGPAGAGKSAVAQTTCERLAEKGQLLASYFFSRDSSTRKIAVRVVPTLAYQIIQALADQPTVLLDLIERDPRVMVLEASKQLEKLIIEPLDKVISQISVGDVSKCPRFVVIDGIDECEGNENQIRLLTLVSNICDSPLIQSLGIRFLLVSRPESHIHQVFNGLLKPISTVESLYGAMKDVRRYFTHSFAEIHDSEKHHDTMQYVEKPWPGESIIQELTRRSGGYFIYAATVVRYIDEEGYLCMDRLEEVLTSSQRAFGSSPFMELDKMYLQVLSKVRNPTEVLNQILGCLVVGRGTLVWFHEFGPEVPTSSIISTLLHLRPGELKMLIRGLHSVLWLGNDSIDDLRFYHASLSDFLLDKERSGSFYVDFEQTIQGLYLVSLRLSRPPESTMLIPTE